MGCFEVNEKVIEIEENARNIRSIYFESETMNNPRIPYGLKLKDKVKELKKKIAELKELIQE